MGHSIKSISETVRDRLKARQRQLHPFACLASRVRNCVWSGRKGACLPDLPFTGSRERMPLTNVLRHAPRDACPSARSHSCPQFDLRPRRGRRPLRLPERLIDADGEIPPLPVDVRAVPIRPRPALRSCGARAAPADQLLVARVFVARLLPRRR